MKGLPSSRNSSASSCSDWAATCEGGGGEGEGRGRGEEGGGGEGEGEGGRGGTKEVMGNACTSEKTEVAMFAKT